MKCTNAFFRRQFTFIRHIKNDLKSHKDMYWTLSSTFSPLSVGDGHMGFNLSLHQCCTEPQHARALPGPGLHCRGCVAWSFPGKSFFLLPTQRWERPEHHRNFVGCAGPMLAAGWAGASSLRARQGKRSADRQPQSPELILHQAPVQTVYVKCLPLTDRG